MSGAARRVSSNGAFKFTSRISAQIAGSASQIARSRMREHGEAFAGEGGLRAFDTVADSHSPAYGVWAEAGGGSLVGRGAIRSRLRSTSSKRRAGRGEVLDQARHREREDARDHAAATVRLLAPGVPRHRGLLPGCTV